MSGNNQRINKLPFDIDTMLERIDEAVRPFPKAAMFDLHERGYTTPFEQLVACIISIRTKDEVSLPTAMRLLDQARTPAAMVQLHPDEIDGLIATATFHEPKSRQIHAIAQRLVDEHGGELPCDGELMQSFSGVGPKCANLTLGVACGHPSISVDIHVHRVTNRWGYVRASSPEATMDALTDTLPHEHSITINRLLVPFGKHICTGKLPRCSTCPVLEWCHQVGVTSHR